MFTTGVDLSGFDAGFAQIQRTAAESFAGIARIDAVIPPPRIDAGAWGAAGATAGRALADAVAGQVRGAGVIATVWWSRVLTPEQRVDIEAPWVRKYGRDEGLSYAWRDYPVDARPPAVFAPA